MRGIEDIVCLYNLKPINYTCGSRNYNMFVASVVCNPYEIVPTEGEHDYRKCEGCQRNRKLLVEAFQKRAKVFPLCCEFHRKLLTLPNFSVKPYYDIAEKTADKVIFTYQHIINSQNKEDWKIQIKDYLDYVIDSFGVFPKGFGEPFLLSSFIFFVKKYIQNYKDIRSNVKTYVFNYFDSLSNENGDKDPLRLLFGTYDKWLRFFPFDISLFKGLKKEYLTRSPLIFKKAKVNPYYRGECYSLITPDELVGILLDITRMLLSDVTKKQKEDISLLSLDYYKELISQELNIESEELLSSQSESYTVIIKKWLSHQQTMCVKLQAVSRLDDNKYADSYPNDSYKESLLRIKRFKIEIEDKGSNTLFEKDQSENQLQKLFKLFWNNSVFCVDREVNNGRGPADFKISKGSDDCTIIEFKLASSSKLKQNLKNQVNAYCKVNDTYKSITVIAYFNEKERNRAVAILKELNLLGLENCILINCQPCIASASNIK